MAKRTAVLYILALVVTFAISLFPLPVWLAWTLRGGVIAAALLGIYLACRDKDGYRYTVEQDREGKAGKE